MINSYINSIYASMESIVVLSYFVMAVIYGYKMLITLAQWIKYYNHFTSENYGCSVISSRIGFMNVFMNEFHSCSIIFCYTHKLQL
jgi:hypothetical protein